MRHARKGESEHVMNTTAHDQAEWLRLKLITLSGKILSVDEMRDALGLKQSTYYLQLRQGRLVNAENIKNAARSLGINELQLMLECDLISKDALDSYNERQGWRRPPPPL